MVVILATNASIVLVATIQMKTASAKAIVQLPFLDALGVTLADLDIAQPAQTDSQLGTQNVA